MWVGPGPRSLPGDIPEPRSLSGWGGYVQEVGWVIQGVEWIYQNGVGIPDGSRYPRRVRITEVWVGGRYTEPPHMGPGILPIHLPGTDTMWWPLQHIRLPSGWYTSYWNAFVIYALLNSYSDLFHQKMDTNDIPKVIPLSCS